MTRRGAERVGESFDAGERDVSGWEPPPKGASGMAESPGQDGPGARTKLVNGSRRQQGTRAWGLRSGNEPIGRTKSPRVRGLLVGGLDFRVSLTTGSSRAVGTTRPTADRVSNIKRWVSAGLSLSFMR